MWNTLFKRILGIIIIFVTLYINKRYLIYGYVISSYIGFVFTAWLYCKLSKRSHFTFHLNSIIILLPSFLYYSLLVVVCSYVNIVLLQALVAIFLFVMYVFGAVFILNPKLLTDKNMRKELIQYFHIH